MLAIALMALVLITLMAAPNTNLLRRGSTYGRSPGDYGAWYAFMQERNTPVQRWQKPLDELIHPSPGKSFPAPITLLRISNRVQPLTERGLKDNDAVPWHPRLELPLA
jgi:hypothetical protein